MIATTHPAQQYFDKLFGPTDIVCLTFISTTKTYASGYPVVENVFMPMSEVITDAGIQLLTERNESDHVYVSMAPFKPGSKRRTKPNIAEARRVFIEADGNGDDVLTAVHTSVVEGEIPPPTFILQSSPHKFQFIWNVVGFTVPIQEAMNRTLAQKFSTDEKAVDAARVLRIPGFRNLKKKYADPKPLVEIVEYNEPPAIGITILDFHIPLTCEPDTTVHPVASDAVIQQSIDLLEAAMDEASVSYTRKVWDGNDGAYKFLLALCPWRENHTDGEPSDAMAFVQPSGAYGFSCFHDHCVGKGWDEFRVHLENLAGHKLSFKSNPAPTAPTQPDVSLTEGAFYGLLGRIIRKLHLQTESHPMGNLLELMTSVGSMIGRTAYIQMEGTTHFCNLFFVRVGITARSRKGTGKDRVAEIMKLVNPAWLQDQNTSGLGSGEGVIWAIRDQLMGLVQDKKTRKWNRELIDPGVENKTLHISEGEFVGVITVTSRKDNILSKIIRDGWDGKPLRNTVKTSPCSCMEPHLSIACDITKSELLRGLAESEKFNGFANRFLWAHVSRIRELPHGGEPIDWTAEVRELQNAIGFAQDQKRVYMDRNAKLRWERMYHDLGIDEPGIVGAVTARAEPQVIRMALIFALLDLSEDIKVEHLEAANAVWQYCLASARFIFGKTAAMTDSLTHDQAKLLAFLIGGTKNRKQISVECFRRNKSADAITRDLDVLKELPGLSQRIKMPTGRPFSSSRRFVTICRFSGNAPQKDGQNRVILGFAIEASFLNSVKSQV